jgi:ABC-type amino acid transport system permease subunit
MSTGAILEIALLTAMLYLAMSYPLAVFTRWSESKLGVGRPVV